MRRVRGGEQARNVQLLVIVLTAAGFGVVDPEAECVGIGTYTSVALRFAVLFINLQVGGPRVSVCGTSTDAFSLMDDFARASSESTITSSCMFSGAFPTSGSAPPGPDKVAPLRRSARIGCLANFSEAFR